MKVLVPVADGSEEMETVVVADIMRRAGWTVAIASIHGKVVTCSRGVTLQADSLWDDVDPEEFDLLYLPGGSAGTDAFRSHPGLLEAVRSFSRNGKTVAAICAAPLVLQEAGILEGRKITCHPAARNEIRAAEVIEGRVVADGPVVTSRGAGTALDLAMDLLDRFAGRAVLDAVARGMAI
jgi:4-methyl-5(b-hydroxyethyl)-thiazole monophosphate biosynthesis